MNPIVPAFRSGCRARRGSGLLVLAVLGLTGKTALGQDMNEIISILPSAAGQGTHVLVTFALDTDAPPAPPAGIMPSSVRIGSLNGTSVTHASQYSVTAVFDIPTGEPTGPHDATIVFPTSHGTLVFSMTAGFTVTAGTSLPPDIIHHPLSRVVALGGVVRFTIAASGTDPLTYQWQRNGDDLDGATEASCTIHSVSEADAGGYRCVVTNDYGTATSNEAVLTVAQVPRGVYTVVDTGQTACYDQTGEITCPDAGEPYHGQDAQHSSHAPSYTLSGDGLTVYDHHTGLTWQRSPDTDGNNDIDINDKRTWADAQAYPAVLNAQTYGGHGDWRLPTIKELYSLIDFRGTDPSGCDVPSSCPGIVPFIDTGYFDFAYGDTGAGERLIDAQYASSTLYVASPPGGSLLFGVNFADGRIKGYGLTLLGQDKTFYVICVRGNPHYGTNDFVDSGNGTILDRATGLMWQQADSGVGQRWEEALSYAEGLALAGYHDWRLPSAKELHSILDYTRSPDTTASPAIDPVFATTSITNEAGQVDYPCDWTATTHVNWTAVPGRFGAYVAFGRAMGYLDGVWQDVHGAGAQRSDPKEGDPADWPYGNGPQGDAVRIFNFARCVRGPFLPQDLDCDGDVDVADVALFGACMAGPEAVVSGGCHAADFNADGDVDLEDYASLERCVSGPAGPIPRS